MKSLNQMTEALRMQRSALSAICEQLGASLHATAAGAVFDVFVAEVDSLIARIEGGGFCPEPPAGQYSVDEDKMEDLLGKEFMRRLNALQDLASTLVEQLCTAADQITDDARFEQGLPPLKARSSAANEAPRKVVAQNKEQVRAHGREYLGTSLRDYACALESLLQSLPNLLTGAALLALSARMPEEPLAQVQ